MDTTNSLVNIVRDVVEDMVDNFQSFTSLDVSNAVKTLGHTFRHREVSQALREEVLNSVFLRNSEYLKTRISVQLSNGQTTSAFLYHHETVSPDEYTQRSQVAIRPVGNVSAQEDVTVRRSISDLWPTTTTTEDDSETTETTEEVEEGGPTTPPEASPGDVENPHSTLFGQVVGTPNPVVSPARRTLAEAVSRVRRSIFDVASRAQTLVCRKGPRANSSLNEETTIENSYSKGVEDARELRPMAERSKAYLTGYSTGIAQIVGELRAHNNASATPEPTIVEPVAPEPATTEPVVAVEPVANPLRDVVTSQARDTTTRGITAECRLEIPPAWLVSLGWHASDYIAAVEVTSGDESAIELLRHERLTEYPNELGIVRVTPDRRLRVSKTIMTQSSAWDERDGGHTNLWTMELLDNSIIIR